MSDNPCTFYNYIHWILQPGILQFWRSLLIHNMFEPIGFTALKLCYKLNICLPSDSYGDTYCPVWWYLEVGAFGPYWVMKVKPLWMELLFLRERSQRTLLPFPCEDIVKRGHVWTRKWALIRQAICWKLALGLPRLQKCEKFMLFIFHCSQINLLFHKLNITLFILNECWVFHSYFWFCTDSYFSSQHWHTSPSALIFKKIPINRHTDKY